jgi:hypothetical protein
VTVIALKHGMCAQQWEAILMIANVLHGHLPAFHRMAVLAIGTELAPMNVCMAIRAMRAYVLEDQAGVTLRTPNLFVHPAQRIARMIVVELGIRSYWFPTGIRMALLARNGKRTMGISNLGLWASNAWV